jgi:hypothetical protein
MEIITIKYYRTYYATIFCILIFLVSSAEAKVWNFVAIEYSTNSADQTHHVLSQQGIPDGYTSFLANSVSDMVNQIQSYMGPGDTIGVLEIRAHGGHGIQAMGGGRLHWRLPDKGIHLYNMPEWKNTLMPLKGKFESGGKIRLLGCRVGANEEGSQLLFELQNFLFTNAEGAADYVFVVAQENYEDYGDIQISQYPSSSPPDPIAPSWYLIALLSFLISQSIPTLSEWKQIFLTLIMLSLVMGFMRKTHPKAALSYGGTMLRITDSNFLAFNRHVYTSALKWVGVVVVLGLAGATVIFGHVSALDITGTLFCAPLVAYILHLVILCKNDSNKKSRILNQY